MASNLGGLLRAQGKLSLAEPYYRRALEGNERTLGRDHPNTLSSGRLHGEICFMSRASSTSPSPLCVALSKDASGLWDPITRTR